MTVEPRLVDDGPHSSQCRSAMLRDGVSEERHRASIGMCESQQHADERGLAGAVWTEVTECASPRNEEFYAIHSDVVSEPLCQSMGLHRPVALSGLYRRCVRGECGAHLMVPLTTVPKNFGHRSALAVCLGCTVNLSALTARFAATVMP
jgi:hypothetical protein